MDEPGAYLFETSNGHFALYIEPTSPYLRMYGQGDYLLGVFENRELALAYLNKWRNGELKEYV